VSILHPEQQPIADTILSNLDACELYNIPTGRGKTFILLDVAKNSIKKDKKKVIISVPNNYLAREMYQVAVDFFGFTEKNSVIKIGRDNYIDKNKLVSAVELGILDEYCELDTLSSYLDKYFEDDVLFFDDFNRMITFKELPFENIVRQIICFSDMNGFEIEFLDLTITNHYYLLSKSVYDKNFNIGEYVLLVDEVHEIADVAEQIMTDSFSPFEYKNTLSLLRREVSQMNDFHGKMKLEKIIKTQEVKSHKFFKKHLNGSLVGEYITSRESVSDILEGSREILASSNHKYIESFVMKSTFAYQGAFLKYQRIIPSLDNQKIESNKVSFGVYFSPSKGYPTLRTAVSNPMGRLHTFFWEKVSMFAGVSGSITCSFSPDESETRYGYSRLGMLKKDEKRTIHFYDRIFPKENIRVFMPEDDFYEGIEKDSVYGENFDEDQSPYYEKILDAIYTRHENKNSIVLCSGYKECKYLAETYRLKYNDAIIHYANTKEKTYATVEKFKKRGGLLFATKNYGTGLSLEGELLEKLFILKLPYPDYTSKKWQDIKSKGAGMFRKLIDREMLVTLIQILGRVPRTKEDKGDIILLDYRYSKTKSQIKGKVVSIIKEYGIIQKKSEKNVKKTYEKEMKNLFL